MGDPNAIIAMAKEKGMTKPEEGGEKKIVLMVNGMEISDPNEIMKIVKTEVAPKCEDMGEKESEKEGIAEEAENEEMSQLLV